LATKGILALAAGSDHAALQSTVATADASQGTNSREEARSHGSGRGRSGRGGAIARHQDPKTDPCRVCK